MAGLFGGLFLAGSGLLGGVPSVIIALISVAFAWRLTPRFWWTISRGALAGAVAGLLVLGPGWRFAMRVVAILDPIRAPEFTIDGTMFILLFVGAILGGLFGAMTAPIQRAFSMEWQAAALIPALLAMTLIVTSQSLRTELMELGLGGWFNIPLFGGVALAYGLATTRIIHRLFNKVSEPAPEPLNVPA